MQVQIKFTRAGSSTAIGGFSPGDVARVPADLARHLVVEAGCAKYVDAPPAKPVQQQQQPTRGKRRRSAES